MPQEGTVGLRIEHRFAPVEEPTSLQFDRAQDLHALALARDRHIRRMSHATPSRVQGRVLSKTSLIAEDQRPPFDLGFFFKRG